MRFLLVAVLFLAIVCVSRSEGDRVSGTCTCWGDPHCLSFDQTRFDYHGNCTYTIVDTFEECDLQVQGHFHEINSGTTSTVALAFQHRRYETPVIQVQCRGKHSPELKIDGVPVEYSGGLEIPDVEFKNNGNNEMTFTFDGGEVVTTKCPSKHMRFEIKVSGDRYYEKTTGLCGLWNGQSHEKKDLVHRDGNFTSCPGNICYPTDFGNSWEVKTKNDEYILFSFGPDEKNVCHREL